jgi:[acyl-carrier-protein] S-malonyltransferase
MTQPGRSAELAVVFPGISPVAYRSTAKFLLIDRLARELTAEADEVLGYHLIDAYRDCAGEYAEPARIAFLVSCLALGQSVARQFGAEPGICTGPSFGGTPAAVHSGALGFADAVTLTARWGQHAEQYFAQRHQDVVTQSFARTSPESLELIRAELTEQGSWSDVACYVDRDFTMLTLPEDRLDWLHQRLRGLGGLPLYTMRPPMHSELFRPLRDTIEREVLASVPFADPQIPIVSDHDGTVLTTGEQVRTMLLDAAVRPVKWPAVAATLAGRGVTRVAVAGKDGLWGRVSSMTEHFEVVTLTPDTALRPRRSAAA